MISSITTLRPSIPLILITSFLLLSSPLLVSSEDPYVFVDWVVTYSHISPYGVQKQVIMINDQFPGPLLNTTTNDNVFVNVHNQLSEPFLLTWNGVQMRKNSWNDGVEGTNCPIAPGKNWTYSFQMKDQIGSFFYFPSFGFQKAAGGYGPIRINNREIILIPFDQPEGDFDVLIGDWYNADYKELRSSLDDGAKLPAPDGVLINGLPQYKANFTFQPGATYRLRISNVGLKATLNFQIQGHKLLLIETEGSYTIQQYYDTLDIHVGQSYSVLITADQPGIATYYMIAKSRFSDGDIPVTGVAFVHYSGSNGQPVGSLPQSPCSNDYTYSMKQALSIRRNLTAGAARPNPQGSYHYERINITRTIILENGAALISSITHYTVNGVSFVYPDTPLKLADYYHIPDVFTLNGIPDTPDGRVPVFGTPVIDALYKDFVQIVFQNNQPIIQTWHLDGYSFFVVGMDGGNWDESKKQGYNMMDAVSRSTIQVYPFSWSAVLVALDNLGMWNIRSQDEEKRYLGQEVYMRVRGVDTSVIPNPRDENPIPSNIIKCGRAAN
ncbi:monocopper oxidase-like protein SKS1 [Dioscorea cayenensis subsp. rotundata]|uniref:Monocopper oxidase-like protein SKS1 n=1 Tax=Dioscorea cayennensis subsp. rotundata TaxID=55577 RepID=A0AB40AFN5_DIOCR|nr:monocopper oxidase-like protein SKS1 [Dioscorea cayenensis subsp. rotundata]